MPSPAHWEHQVAKTPTKAAQRRLHAIDRIAALTIGEPPAFSSETVADRTVEVDGLTAALSGADRCLRCGKSLKRGVPRARGYGDDCWQIELAAGRVKDTTC